MYIISVNRHCIVPCDNQLDSRGLSTMMVKDYEGSKALLKIFFKKIAGLELDFLSKRQRLYNCSAETQLSEKTVKWILIHASVDFLNSLNSANFAPFRENPIISTEEEYLWWAYHKRKNIANKSCGDQNRNVKIVQQVSCKKNNVSIY